MNEVCVLVEPKQCATKTAKYLFLELLNLGPDEVPPACLEESRCEVLGNIFWQRGQGVGVDFIRRRPLEGQVTHRPKLGLRDGGLGTFSNRKKLQMVALRERTATAVLRSPIARLPELAMGMHARSHRNSLEIEMVLAFGNRSGADRSKVFKKSPTSDWSGSAPARTASR